MKMVSTNYNYISKEEFLRNLIKYSIPLFSRKAEVKKEGDGLSDLIKDGGTGDKSNTNLVYLDNYQQERLSRDYASTIGTYLNKRQEALQDFTDHVPGKHLNILPESLMGGVLGFTYLGENFMARRADLTDDTAKMVDIHESIHTPNEYETRVLTSWIMLKEMPKYIK